MAKRKTMRAGKFLKMHYWHIGKSENYPPKALCGYIYHATVCGFPDPRVMTMTKSRVTCKHCLRVLSRMHRNKYKE